MSYSFSVYAESKTEAILAAQAYFEANVLANQPIHKTDMAAAFENVLQHIALLRDPVEGEIVTISMNGSIIVQEFGVGQVASGCSVMVSPKPA